MLERQRKTKAPCEVCFLHLDRCICVHIPRLDLATRLVLVVHAKELKRTTNTGRLAVTALRNSEMRVRGQIGEALDLSDIPRSDYVSVLLYPSDDAVDLAEFIKNRHSTLPVQLIVPDGNWRQAAKVSGRHPELAHLPRIKLTRGLRPSTPGHLRKEHMPDGMSTLEAIAEAYRVLEGPAAGQALMDLYLQKLHRTLEGRGQQDLLL